MSKESAYESFFDRMNRAEKRKFEKLPNEEKINIFTAEIVRKCMDGTKEEITRAFYNGYVQAHVLLAQNYVNKLLETEDQEEAQKLSTEMFSRIIEVYNKYLEAQKDEIKEEAKQEEENA